MRELALELAHLAFELLALRRDAPPLLLLDTTRLLGEVARADSSASALNERARLGLRLDVFRLLAELGLVLEACIAQLELGLPFDELALLLDRRLRLARSSSASARTASISARRSFATR